MAKTIYFWTEDRQGKSGYQFWECFLGILYPQVILESKTNSSELVKAVAKINSEDTYIIALDHSFDNDQVIREVSTLRRVLKNKKNVYELDLICFEYILLSFPLLLDWIYAKEDEFREKRAELVAIREKLLMALEGQCDYREIPEIKAWMEKNRTYNIERTTAGLLYGLTRNTGFEVDKSNLGICWKMDCCDGRERADDDKCGLDGGRLTLAEKMRFLMEKGCLKAEFEKIGLEAAI